MNYMFPAEHTKLHVFNKSSKVWEDKHVGKSLYALQHFYYSYAYPFTPPLLLSRGRLLLMMVCIDSNFKIFNVATTFTPAMVIENVLAGKAAPKGWAITEVVEKGDGAWAKVSRNCLFQLMPSVKTHAKITFLTGHDNRTRRRPCRRLPCEHGLDGQARRQPAACLGGCAQGLRA